MPPNPPPQILPLAIKPNPQPPAIHRHQTRNQNHPPNNPAGIKNPTRDILRQKCYAQIKNPATANPQPQYETECRRNPNPNMKPNAAAPQIPSPKKSPPPPGEG